MHCKSHSANPDRNTDSQIGFPCLVTTPCLTQPLSSAARPEKPQGKQNRGPGPSADHLHRSARQRRLGRMAGGAAVRRAPASSFCPVLAGSIFPALRAPRISHPVIFTFGTTAPPPSMQTGRLLVSTVGAAHLLHGFVVLARAWHSTLLPSRPSAPSP